MFSTGETFKPILSHLSFIFNVYEENGKKQIEVLKEAEIFERPRLVFACRGDFATEYSFFEFFDEAEFEINKTYIGYIHLKSTTSKDYFGEYDTDYEILNSSFDELNEPEEFLNTTPGNIWEN